MTAFEFLDNRMVSAPIGRHTKRFHRQINAVKKWISTGCRGSIEWPTGVGKTRIATEAIAVLRRDVWNRSVIVVVPTLQLKDQWEKGLALLGMLENSQVFVINGLVKKRLSCELLILDEVHRYAAKTFFKVFEAVTFDFVLGLTATMKRLDKKHVILQEKAPIIDKMSIFEAKKEGYMASYTRYNLAVEMSPEEREIYRDLAGKYNFNMDKFHRDFELMMQCSMGIDPKIIRQTYMAPQVVRYAERLGWKGNTPYKAYQIWMHNKAKARGVHKDEIWGGDTAHPNHPQKLYIWAINGMKAIREIKQFIHNHPGKKAAAISLLRELDKKAIVFGETIESAEIIHTSLPDTTVLYHSKMTKKEREASLNAVFTGTKKVILTARALDQGTDWPEAEMGVEVDRNSSTIQATQRLGRVARLHTFADGEEKRAMYVCIYIPDTKDYDWMNKGQTGGFPAKWVTSIEQILQMERELVNTLN